MEMENGNSFIKDNMYWIVQRSWCCYNSDYEWVSVCVCLE